MTDGAIEVGLAYTLRSDFQRLPGAPDDALEEYDSEETLEGIEQALATLGHRTRRLGYGRALVTGLLARRCDLVFNLAEGHGARSREAYVPATVEMLGIPYTHSDPLTMAVGLDKAMAKRVVGSFGVPTPRFAVLGDPDGLSPGEGLPTGLGADCAGLSLSYPLFVKPLYEGSSMGVGQHSRVDSPGDLPARVAALVAAYRQPALVEEYCPGAEFTVAVLGAGAGARVLGTMEIRPLQVPEADFVNSLDLKRNAEYDRAAEYQVPPRRPAARVAEVEAVALAAYRAIGCRDVGRVDLRLGADGAPKFLEINTLPGLKPGWSELALIAERAGLAYTDLIGAIVDAARARHGI